MNDYEAPSIVRMGEAHELILGVKPVWQFNIDNEGVIDYLNRTDDIDESDD